MSKSILVLINGHAGVGKDTFIDFCKKYAESEKSCKVYNIHRSDAPKLALQNLGWKGEKDAETRELLKHMVDFMEHKGLLNLPLETQIKSAISVKGNNSVILFYHVRDPKVIYELMEKYLYANTPIVAISLLVKRNLDKPKEPNNWWDDLENGDYTVEIQLPPNSLEESNKAACKFVDFLLDESWIVVKQEEHSWITNI